MIKRRALFRVDGNAHIGMGHLVRSLALADVLKSEYQCCIIIQDTNIEIIDYVKSELEDVFIIPSTQDYQSESELISRKYISYNDIVILDGYFFNSEYQLKIKSTGCKLICVDDVIKDYFYSDVIINHAPGININKYKKENYTKVYSGLGYALLREPFYQIQRRKKVPRLLTKGIISFGGSDYPNNTLNYANIFLTTEFNQIEKINLILGASYVHEDLLRTSLKNTNKFEIFKNINAFKLISLIKNSDFALVSASSISIECAKIGIPLYLICTADNQNHFYDFMLRNKCAGNINEITDYNYETGKNMLDLQSSLFPKNIKRNILNIFKLLI